MTGKQPIQDILLHFLIGFLGIYSVELINAKPSLLNLGIRRGSNA